MNVVGDANITGLCVAEDSLISVVDMSDFKGIDNCSFENDEQNPCHEYFANPLNPKNSWLFSDQIRGMEFIKKILIQDIKSGDYVLSLNETSGKLQPAKVKVLLDMGEKPIYELTTESGRAINTTGNHPYLVKGKEDTSTLSSYNAMNLPSKSSGLVSLINLENELSNNSGCFCGILSQTTENISSLVNSLKSSSLVTNTLCSDLENSDSLSSESLFGLKITSKSFLRNCNNSFLTFSSSRNLSSLSFDVNDDIITPLSETSCIMQSCFNMLFCERYKECVKNFFDRSTIFQHLQNLPDHNSCSLESWLAMTNLSICNNIIIYFNSHEISNDDNYLKLSEWLKVTELKIGDEIAVADGDGVKFEKIISIKTHEPQHVYDLAIENTHNFIANDIIAHNTYLGDSTADTVTVAGNITASYFIGDGSYLTGLATGGNLSWNQSHANTIFVPYTGATGNVDLGDNNFSVNGTTLFVDSDNGRIGIGTTTPLWKLDISNSTQGIIMSLNKGSQNNPIINTTGNTNPTITSSGGSVIIRLG